MKKVLAILMLSLVSSFAFASYGGGGGGSASVLNRDYCPFGDDSGSYYDSSCGTFPTDGEVNPTIVSQNSTLAQTDEDGVSSIDDAEMDPKEADKMDGIVVKDTTKDDDITVVVVTRDDTPSVTIKDIIKVRNMQNLYGDDVDLPEVGADPYKSFNPLAYTEAADSIELPEISEGFVAPAYLPMTGSQTRNIAYLFLALFGIFGLVLTCKRA